MKLEKMKMWAELENFFFPGPNFQVATVASVIAAEEQVSITDGAFAHLEVCFFNAAHENKADFTCSHNAA